MASAQRQERLLGAEFWKLLHIVAVNFPDSGHGLTNQRLKGYYDFFNSLQHVLPRKTWRAMWRQAVASGDTELDWKTFQAVENHKQLSRWMFAVHDAVRKDLGQPRNTSYKKLYDMYTPFREGAPSSSSARMNTNEDRAGISQLEKLLRTRMHAVDDYLTHVYDPGVVELWSRARKQKMRSEHLRDAAEYFWESISKKFAKTDKGFNKLTEAQRRTRILTNFNYNYRLRHQRVINNVRSIPGRLKNYILA